MAPVDEDVVVITHQMMMDAFKRPPVKDPVTGQLSFPVCTLKTGQRCIIQTTAMHPNARITFGVDYQEKDAEAPDITIDMPVIS